MAKRYKTPEGTISRKTAVKLYKAMEREFAQSDIVEFGAEEYFSNFSEESWASIINSYLENVDTNTEILKIKSQLATAELKKHLIKKVCTPSGMQDFLSEFTSDGTIDFLLVNGKDSELLSVDNKFELTDGGTILISEFKDMIQYLVEQNESRVRFSGKDIKDIIIKGNHIRFVC